MSGRGPRRRGKSVGSAPARVRPPRRRLLAALAGLSTAGWLAACRDGAPGWLRALKGRQPAPPLLPADEARALVGGGAYRARYRDQHSFLLQGVPRTHLDSRLSGGRPMRWDQFGPTFEYVDAHTGWRWATPGGDWIDRRGLRQGPEHWFEVDVDEPAAAPPQTSYAVDVTALVRHCASTGHWLALLLRMRHSARTIGWRGHPSASPPAIDVVYEDGERSRLACRVLAPLNRSSSQPVTAAPAAPLPVVLEFERPAAPVRSARFRFTLTERFSGLRPVLEAFLLNPPLNDGSVRHGLSARAGRLDEGLEAVPGVIGLHRYLDGRPREDFVHAEGQSLSAEERFDPALFGIEPPGLDRWPHAGLGKWINAGPAWDIVPSTYQGDGFEPLAPGLGALRLQMPAAPGVTDGAVVGHDGTLAAHARIFMPEPLFGRLDRIFVRYYVRIGLPGRVTAGQRLHVRHGPGTGQDAWTSLSGKFGICPDHSTSLGGVSGSSGGGAGWQMRLAWYDCDAGVGGPDEGGWAPGFHLTDFQSNNPAGHRYGTEFPPQFERWGQQGGRGGLLYAAQWYCVETELRLNSLAPLPRGHDADGELRAWLDGRLVYEQKGLVFRSAPLHQPPYQAHRLRPCRELGVTGLWMNWFHGGQTVNTVDRTLFYAGLAWARQYIGPMQS